MKKIFLILIGWAFVGTSCSNDVDYGEQYKKMLYIVGSKDKLVYTSHEMTQESPGNISVYCTGSELPSEDIHATYKLDAEALAEFNRNEYGDYVDSYFLMVPADKITFSSEEILIKKGEEYGRLSFKINTMGLQQNRLYILPITILGNSEYEAKEGMSTVFYVISINNKYAGSYMSTYERRNPNGSLNRGSVHKNLKAMTATQLLLPLDVNSNAENDLDFSNQYYLININPDNTVTISPYLQAVIEQDPNETSYYDPIDEIIYVYYKQKDQYDDDIYFKEVLKKI